MWDLRELYLFGPPAKLADHAMLGVSEMLAILDDNFVFKRNSV